MAAATRKRRHGRKQGTRRYRSGVADSITSSKNALATSMREIETATRSLEPAQSGNGRARSRDDALTAAGFRITQRDMDSLRRLIQPWQSRAFAYYDLLGEIKFAAQFYSRALSQLRLYVAERDDNGEWNETEDKEAKAILARIQDPGGDLSGLLAQYGRLMFLTGEAYLLVTEDPDTGLEQWEMLSTDECRVQSGVVMRYKAPSLMAEEYVLPDDDNAWEKIEGRNAAAYRFWQRHPRWSMLADSTMQGVLDLCEELVILTRAVRSRARSRLAGSGILLIDERIGQEPDDAGVDEDPAEDPFLADLTQAMTLPIQNEGSASAVVPLVVRVAAPQNMSVKDMMAHIQIIDPTQLYPETGLRLECIHRIAIGLDMPPEALEGSGESNHWTAWVIDEQTWKHHLQPKAKQLVDDLTASYFRRAMGAAKRDDWSRFAIKFDATSIINHPDRAKDAKDLHDKEVISDETLRDACGFTEDDAITDEDEFNRRVGIKLRDASFVKYGEPGVKAGGVEVGPGDIVSSQGEGTAAEVTPGPPLVSPAKPDEAPAATTGAAMQAFRILAAADLAVLRARELAGNRIRTQARRNEAASALIDGVKANMVAHTIGHDEAQRLTGLNNRQLIQGCRDTVLEALALWRINGAVAEVVAENVEQYAAQTLFEPLQLMPPAFRGYVTGLLTTE